MEMDDWKKEWKPQIRWGITMFAVLVAVSAAAFIIFHIAAIGAALGRLFGVLAPIIYGVVFAYILTPVYDCVRSWMVKIIKQRFHLKNPKTIRSLAKVTATVVSVAVFLFVVVGVISMIIPELYKSVRNLITTVPSAGSDLPGVLDRILAGHPEAKDAAQNAYYYLQSLWEKASDNIQPYIDNIMSRVSDGVFSVISIVKNTVLGVIVMLYLLNIKEKLLGQLRKLCFAVFPTGIARSVLTESAFVNQVFSGFVFGKIVDSIIIGILTFVVLSIMNMPYTMLVSVIVGVTNVIPFFGPFIGAVPSFVLILLVSPIQSIYFLIAILVIQQLDGNVIGPKVLGNSTGLSSFWVLFAILLFGGLYGFVGMIIAVPTWAVILHLVRALSERALSNRGLPLSSRDYQTERERGAEHLGEDPEPEEDQTEKDQPEKDQPEKRNPE